MPLAKVSDAMQIYLQQRAESRIPTDHINIRMLQTVISNIPLYLDLEPECEVLVFMWSSGPQESTMSLLIRMGMDAILKFRIWCLSQARCQLEDGIRAPTSAYNGKASITKAPT